MESIGFNSKFTEMQAVIGIEQLKKLSFRVNRKKEIWKQYEDNLTDINQIMFFDHNLDYTSPWFIDCICENRDDLMVFLKEHFIGSRVMYPPINEQKCYLKDGHYPVSKEIEKKDLWLPSYTQLSNQEIDYITKQVQYFYTKKSA